MRFAALSKMPKTLFAFNRFSSKARYFSLNRSEHVLKSEYEQEKEETNATLKSIKISLDHFIKKQTEFNEYQRNFNEAQKNFNEAQRNFNSKIDARLLKLSLGMGDAFERYNKSWLFKIHPDAKNISTRFLFPDPTNTVHKNQNFVELDLFSSEPLIVAEVKTFIDTKQFQKLKMFAKKVDLIKMSYKTDDVKAYVFAYGLDRSLGVEEFLINRKIQLVVAEDD